MGIHINLYRNVCEDHPEWDSCRHSGDRDFPGVFAKVQDVRNGDKFDYDVRPADIEELRAAIRASNLENKARFFHLCDLLERDTDYWISFGF